MSDGTEFRELSCPTALRQHHPRRVPPLAAEHHPRRVPPLAAEHHPRRVPPLAAEHHPRRVPPLAAEHHPRRVPPLVPEHQPCRVPRRRRICEIPASLRIANQVQAATSNLNTRQGYDKKGVSGQRKTPLGSVRQTSRELRSEIQARAHPLNTAQRSREMLGHGAQRLPPCSRS